tara:strand:+ start:1701 stop:1910 length:210 start_codon:yes stop_codon:yes gene_type:complete
MHTVYDVRGIQLDRLKLLEVPSGCRRAEQSVVIRTTNKGVPACEAKAQHRILQKELAMSAASKRWNMQA